MSVYRNRWKSWKDVAGDFQITLPEPEEVIFADYTHADCCGDAFVVYREGDKYFTVTGSHCSCYGLEDEWKTEEYPSLDFLIEVLTKGFLRNSDVLDILKARRTPNPPTPVPPSGGFTKH